MLLPRVDLISVRTMAYFVGILLDLDDMLFQLFRILDVRFRLEECFFLRIQSQQRAVEVKSTEERFGVNFSVHDCRMGGLWV